MAALAKPVLSAEAPAEDGVAVLGERGTDASASGSRGPRTSAGGMGALPHGVG